MLSKKHILVLTSWYPNEKEPHLGNFVEQFAQALSKRHQVTLLYLDQSDSEKKGVTVENQQADLTICRINNSKKGVRNRRLAYKAGIDFIRKNVRKIDLIHAQIGIRDSFFFLLVKKRLSLPLVYTEHGSYFTRYHYSKLSFFKRLGLQLLLKQSDHTTAVSAVLAQHMTAVSGTEIQIIGNFLPNNWFAVEVKPKQNDIYRFLHISTLDENKNAEGIIDACKILLEQGQINWHFTVISEEDTSELERRVVANELQKHVSIHGHVPHEKLPDVFAKHDCFVLNSFHETFSIVNAEALCFGLHVITTPVGFLSQDAPDFIDIVEIDNPDQLAEKMNHAIQEKKHSGLLGRKFVEQFREDTILDAYDQVYQQTLST